MKDMTDSQMQVLLNNLPMWKPQPYAQGQSPVKGGKLPMPTLKQPAPLDQSALNDEVLLNLYLRALDAAEVALGGQPEKPKVK